MNAETETIDRSKWGSGPWDAEPDRLEWEHASMPCLAVRHPTMGHWCGYVAVPQTHASYAASYDDVNVNVHGGLTYASACRGVVCHVPKPGASDDVWWFGFDCAHCGDFSPATNQYHHGYPWPDVPYDHATALVIDDWRTDQYRTLAYVQTETNRLADQLAEQP